MKNWIIALEVSDLRSKAAIHADFDSKEEAEDHMLGLKPTHFCVGEIVVLKRQDRNQWWQWDWSEPTQGWIAFEVPEVVEGRNIKEVMIGHAQRLIEKAAKLEQIDPAELTACVESALKTTKANICRANAALIIAKAEQDFLEVVLEAHGNIEWPETE